MKVKIHITIEYHTKWGEELKITGSIPEWGSFKEEDAITLNTLNGISWFLETTIEVQDNTPIQYKYLVTKGTSILRREPTNLYHHINNRSYTSLYLKDTWLDYPKEDIKAYPIYNTIWATDKNLSSEGVHNTLLLEAIATDIEEHHKIAIIGNQKALGNWDIAEAVILSSNNRPFYHIYLDKDKITYPLEYKYILLDKENKIKEWENNSNRILYQHDLHHMESIKVNEGYLHFSSKSSWKGVGVTVPVFSLRSKDSWGIGEFPDLKKLGDWASLTGMKLIQILPINDTISTHTWADSYPYKCSSVFALNPIYLNLEKLGILNTKYKQEYISLQEQLNKTKHIEFPEVLKKKLIYISELFNLYGKDLLDSKAYNIFYNDNQEWLLPYATYLYFRTHYKTNNTSEWRGNGAYSKDIALELFSQNKKARIHFKQTFYTQFCLHQQLKEASDYIKSKGIALKGDLPIGISKQSLDAWQYPRLFNLKSQAGAPPDAFAQLGQNWGFPTYNWAEISKNNYEWWINRLKHMEQYYAAFRIDHILGFFRIWSIPNSAIYGILGQFEPAMPLSKQEMLTKFDFNFEEIYSKPYITEQLLSNKISDKEQLINIKSYFLPTNNGVYIFKEEYNNQLKISKSPINDQDKKVLLDLHTEVLFLKDNNKQDLYHPRIDAQKSYLYSILSKEDKSKFNTLYTDFFYHRHNTFWKNEAYHKLPALIRASNMLVCGEDLGMIPASVPEVMNSLSILSLEVARMPKETSKQIGNPQEYPYFSISTFSTHDMPTLRGWWSKNKENRDLLLNQTTHTPNETENDLSNDMAYKIIFNELKGNSILCIEALQDWLSLSHKYRVLEASDEQINIPSNPNHKWRYRMPCTLEALISDIDINQTIRNIIKQTDRL